MKTIQAIAALPITASSKTLKSGHRNVPRYFYHVTNKKNYENMLKDGFIKAGQDAYEESNLNGVFMFDLKNFTKRWCHMGFDIGENSEEKFFTLAKALFMKISLKSSDIVVLRIPSKELPLDKLKCRIQGGVKVSDIPLSHALNGDSAFRQKHYTRKRQPVEYIFEGNIPLDHVQKAGEANTGVIFEEMRQDMSGRSLYTKLKTKEILTNLFKGQPEEKCIEQANKSSIKFRNLFE